jgi:hypothetical protein
VLTLVAVGSLLLHHCLFCAYKILGIVLCVACRLSEIMKLFNLIVTYMLFADSWAIKRVLKGGGKKSTKKNDNTGGGYSDIPGTYTEGNMLAFYEYTDDACSDLVSIHGNPTGICQQATSPAAQSPFAGDYWMIMAGSNTDTTFVFYQFFDDELCNKASEGAGPPNIAVGNENWPAYPACNNRGAYWKSFQIRDDLPEEYFYDGILATTHKTQKNCQDGALPIEYNYVKAGKCSAEAGYPTAVPDENFAVPDTIYHCENGVPTISIYETKNSTCQGLKETLTYSQAETCQSGDQTILRNGLGWINFVCV